MSLLKWPQIQGFCLYQLQKLTLLYEFKEIELSSDLIDSKAFFDIISKLIIVKIRLMKLLIPCFTFFKGVEAKKTICKLKYLHFILITILFINTSLSNLNLANTFILNMTL